MKSKVMGTSWAIRGREEYPFTFIWSLASPLLLPKIEESSYERMGIRETTSTAWSYVVRDIYGSTQ